MTKYSKVGSVDTLDVFDDFTTEKERIRRNSTSFKDDAKYSNVFDVVVGETYYGRLVQVFEREYLFDIGHKSYVSVLKTGYESDYLDKLVIGEITDVLVQFIDETDTYSVYGSIAAAKEANVREKLSNMEDFVLADITEMTPSGYNAIIKIDGFELSAFMPHILAGANKILDQDRIKLVGKQLEVCVESFIAEKGTYIINRKEYLKRLYPEKIKLLQKNVLYTGVVTGSMTFGIFVEFEDCLTGMIYKSYISDELKNSEITSGMEVSFYVKEVVKDKIILTQTLKESQMDLLNVNDKINATVKSITPNGVLIAIDEETNGMIRKTDSLMDISNYGIGAEVLVKVISIDRANRKIFLSDK